MRANRFTRCSAWTLAALSAVLLAVCEIPEARTAPEEAEPFTVIRGPEEGFRVNIDPETPWTVLADGNEGRGYTCTDPNEDGGKNCWEKCPEPRGDGWSTGCSCRRSQKHGGKFYCTVRDIPPGGQIGEGTGGGCGWGGGDTIDGGELLRCGADPMEIALNCSPLTPDRGQEVRCEATPTNSDYDTEDTYYAWTAECYPLGDKSYGNQCSAAHAGSGNDYKRWSGKATMTADIVVRVSYLVNDSTWVGGSEDEQLYVTPRAGWGSADGLIGNADLDTTSLAPKPSWAPWGRGEWGRYYFETVEFPSYSTKSGSGPWAGTRYLSEMPELKVDDWMYTHPDLYEHGPGYRGAFGLCGGGRPSVDTANIQTVNAACGTGAILSKWRNSVEAHERKHMASHNKCVRSETMQGHIQNLEAVGGWDIEWVAGDVVDALLDDLAAARETNHTWDDPAGMWDWRNLNMWTQVLKNKNSHGGTDGC